MTAIEDRHTRFLTGIRPRLDNLAPVMSASTAAAFGRCLTHPATGPTPALCS
jgi:hypothetical protein